MILILDIGKTNKKCFVFDEDYRIVFEKSTQLAEINDEDGEPCEDLKLLKNWVLTSVNEVLHDTRFQIRAINVTTYGASFVHLNSEGHSLTPLYNYLKPFPEELRKHFFDTYGPETKIALETASPVLGNLNSGLQLYWLKNHKPLVFKAINCSLHLPQYVAFVVQSVSRMFAPRSLRGEHTRHGLNSEITSIGCHTMLWDFRKNEYHDWVKAEGFVEKFPPIKPSNAVVPIPKSPNLQITIGTGLHDSSAALIPYLACFDEPFVLISTGTWCISLNPFNHEPLTPEELAQDCLCYLSYEGKPVKAARYFGGHEHEQTVKKLVEEFGVAVENRLRNVQGFANANDPEIIKYHTFMRQLLEKQVVSTKLAIGNTPIRRIFVDGGFSKNETYMHLLAEAFPELEVYAAEVSQSTALGAAMAIHNYWNEKPLSKDLISLKNICV
ncbi:MAG: FGGY family carbohydrate kinase [Saprospiraceae bacterium]|nr:FGGY family carbohydrate kinase [Saprospiraceae bacterium]